MNIKERLSGQIGLVRGKVDQKRNFIIIIVIMIIGSSLPANAQILWTKHANNPVVNLGEEGSWESAFVYQPWVIKEDTVYHMWYAGNSTGNDEGGQIGYARSADGVNWTKYLNNPVVSGGGTGAWDEGIGTGSVIFGDTSHMWYTGYDGISYRIGHAYSTDTLNWIRDSKNPVIDLGSAGSWEDTWVSIPVVYYDGELYQMWYAGYDGTHDQIGYATSTDGSSWSKYEGNPVLPLGESGSWDDNWATGCSVIFTDSLYKMWYSGGRDARRILIGYATSADGISWEKYESNPVLDVGPAGTWDDAWVWSPCVIFDSSEDIYKMWYQGYDGTSATRIGYAYTPPGGFIDPGNAISPREYILSQNYPNPFNPTTLINFTLPKSGFVELKVYNMLGEEISTLVSGLLNQGNHTYIFDGKKLASGIYYYRFEAGTYVQTRKMIYIK